MFKELRQRYFNFNLKSGMSESQLYSLNIFKNRNVFISEQTGIKWLAGLGSRNKKVNWQIYLFETHETVEQEDDCS